MAKKTEIENMMMCMELIKGAMRDAIKYDPDIMVAFTGAMGCFSGQLLAATNDFSTEAWIETVRSTRRATIPIVEKIEKEMLRGLENP